MDVTYFFLSHIMKISVLPSCYFLLIAAPINSGFSKSLAPILFTKCVIIPIWRGDEVEQTVMCFNVVLDWDPSNAFHKRFFSSDSLECIL